MSEQESHSDPAFRRPDPPAFSTDERAHFVKRNLGTQEDALEIENVTGWEDLSAARRGLAPSIDAGALATRLSQITPDGEYRPKDYRPPPSRSPTPPPVSYYTYETRYFQALLDNGCRPLFHVRLLAQVEAKPDDYRDLLLPWAKNLDASDPKDWQVFSKQWNRWETFRTWQLQSRRRTPSFSEHLDWCRRGSFIHGGTARHAAGPRFELGARRGWESDYSYGRAPPDGGDDGDEATFEKHSEGVKSLLINFGFLQPFQLLADPKQQDQWTTYVEYLAFESFAARELQKRTKEHGSRQKYQANIAAANHQQHRVAWVRSEINKIEAEEEAASKSRGASGTESGSSLSMARSGKRKLTDATDSLENVEEPRLGKRRRTDGADETETDELAAGRSDNPTRTTRSQKHEVSIDDNAPKSRLERKRVTHRSSDSSRTTISKNHEVAADENAPKSHLGRKRVTRRSNGRGTRDAAPSSVLQSLGLEVTAVSRRQAKRKTTPYKVTTPASQERLRSLRLRANGKAACLSRTSISK
ncbi:hypothetical protein F4802DRAFT_17986 [Xylaria palmicola]|nr:hypothetical protein F4802DRAFT_17986 [Xylaria palmicola]